MEGPRETAARAVEALGRTPEAGANAEAVAARPAKRSARYMLAMLAATGLIVQDLFTLPFYSKWYTGEKVWALHDKLVEVGAAKQVLPLLLAFEIPFIQKALNGELDGTGDYGFDPLGLKSDRRAVTEIKNGRLGMIAFGGMMQHYLITGKGPVQFITQIPNFKSCVKTAAELPGAKVASLFTFGKTLEVASALCR